MFTNHASFITYLFVLSLANACAPLTPEETAQIQTKLFWTASQGNDLVYSANSNVALRLRVGTAITAAAVHGNIVISSGRGSDKVSPTQSPVPGAGEIDVLLQLGGPGTTSVTAQLGAQTESLDIEVATPDVSQTTLTFEPNSVVAGEQAALGTLWAKDGAGRNLTGVRATVTTEDPNTHLEPQELITRNAGRDVFSVISNTAGLHTFHISGDGLDFAPTLEVKPAGINSLTSSITFNPTTTVANGQDRTAVLVEVLDAYGNPISGVTVKFVITTGTSIISPTAGITDAQGRLTASLTSTDAGLLTLAAKVYPASSSSVTIIGRTMLVAPR